MTRITPPSRNEWSTETLPSERQVYLQHPIAFEEIVSRIAANATFYDAKIIPFDTYQNKQEQAARQITFRVKTSPQDCDLFYNSQDGLRGRYWQSPDIGFMATKYFIDSLKSRFLEFCMIHTPIVLGKKTKTMGADEIAASLYGSSAKVWPCEVVSQGIRDIAYENRPQLFVSRWKENEEKARQPRQWRWSPCDRDLEIKGALIDPQYQEFIPSDKRDRSCQIHMYGFT